MSHPKLPARRSAVLIGAGRNGAVAGAGTIVDSHVPPRAVGAGRPTKSVRFRGGKGSIREPEAWRRWDASREDHETVKAESTRSVEARSNR